VRCFIIYNPKISKIIVSKETENGRVKRGEDEKYVNISVGKPGGKRQRKRPC
jgi:hypothetical protein